MPQATLLTNFHETTRKFWQYSRIAERSQINKGDSTGKWGWVAYDERQKEEEHKFWYNTLAGRRIWQNRRSTMAGEGEN